MKYQSQKIALGYFAVALALFAVQVTMGLVLGWIYVSPNFLSGLIPFNVGRRPGGFRVRKMIWHCAR